MNESETQSGFDACTATELKVTLREALPYLEKLIAVIHRFYGYGVSPQCNKITQTPLSSKLPCISCPKVETCVEPCEGLNKLLPETTKGRGHRENLSGLHVNTLESIERARRSDIFELYEKCKHLFRPKQWQVICLYYHEEKTEKQIANILCKSRSTVSDLLRRAKKRKEEYDKILRQEGFEQLAKKLNEE